LPEHDFNCFTNLNIEGINNDLSKDKIVLNNENLLQDLKTSNSNNTQQIFHTISTNIAPSENNSDSKFVASLFEQILMTQNKNEEQKIRSEKMSCNKKQEEQE